MKKEQKILGHKEKLDKAAKIMEILGERPEGGNEKSAWEEGAIDVLEIAAKLILPGYKTKIMVT